LEIASVDWLIDLNFLKFFLFEMNYGLLFSSQQVYQLIAGQGGPQPSMMYAQPQQAYLQNGMQGQQGDPNAMCKFICGAFSVGLIGNLLNGLLFSVPGHVQGTYIPQMMGQSGNGQILWNSAVPLGGPFQSVNSQPGMMYLPGTGQYPIGMPPQMTQVPIHPKEEEKFFEEKKI
jgi:hypothetical protein